MEHGLVEGGDAEGGDDGEAEEEWAEGHRGPEGG